MPDQAFPPSTDGTLVPVSRAAEKVLGHAISPRTALRWAIHGRAGVRLPTVRGARGIRCCTVDAFRAWIAASSGNAPAPVTPLTPSAAEKVLASFGLARQVPA